MRVDSPGWTRSQNGRIDFLKRKVDKSKINQIRQYSTSLSFCVTLSLISECCHVCVVVCGLWGSKSYCWNPRPEWGWIKREYLRDWFAPALYYKQKRIYKEIARFRGGGIVQQPR